MPTVLDPDAEIEKFAPPVMSRMFALADSSLDSLATGRETFAASSRRLESAGRAPGVGVFLPANQLVTSCESDEQKTLPIGGKSNQAAPCTVDIITRIRNHGTSRLVAANAY